MACKGFGKGADPNSHGVPFLETYFASMEAEGWNVPPLPGGYGPAWASKGKGKGKAGPYAGGPKGANGAVEVTEKLFVGGLPPGWDEAGVREAFGLLGEVADVELKFDAAGAPRQFCFVTYDSVNAAKRALEEGVELDGRQLEVRAADPGKGKSKGKGKGKGGAGKGWTDLDVTEKLFVGGLPTDTKEPQVREFFELYGKTVEVALKYDANNVFRGFAFVTYEEVESARAVLDTPENVVVNGVQLEVRPAWATDNPALAKKELAVIDDSTPTPISDNVIRVCGMLRESKSRDVFKLFYNWSVTRIRDCGGDDCFVQFTCRSQAQAAYRAKKDAQMGSAWIQLADASQAEFDWAGEQLQQVALGGKDGGGKGQAAPRPAGGKGDAGWGPGSAGGWAAAGGGAWDGGWGGKGAWW